MANHVLSMEEILRTIKGSQEDAFRDNRRLLALFADFSRGKSKAQQNQLRIFLECQGNTCILNLCDATELKQRTEYHRLIQEMVSDYGMREEVALNICSAFWRAVTCTDPPISADKSTQAEPSWFYNVLMHGNAGEINAEEVAKAESATVLGSKILRSQIVSITFLDTLAAAPAARWDVSEAQDGSVLAWVRKNEYLYDLFIAGEGGVNGRFCDGLFAYYINLKEIHFNRSFHTNLATSFHRMFCFCYGLTELNFSGFNTSMVTDMSCMFQVCKSLKTLDVSGFDTSKVKNMASMFSECSSLTELNLGALNTSQVISFDHFMDSGRLINGRPWEELFQ